jgi:hypothetical protein
MISGTTALIVLLALPFGGSIAAMLLPANARNAEAWLAGSIALATPARHIGLLRRGRARAGAARRRGMAARGRARFHAAHGRLRMDVRGGRHRHRLPDRAVRALLHVGAGSRAAVLLVPARVHGLDARRRAVRKPDRAGVLLGADQHRVVPAHRVLASQPCRARRRAHGAGRDIGRRDCACLAAC